MQNARFSPFPEQMTALTVVNILLFFFCLFSWHSSFTSPKSYRRRLIDSMSMRSDYKRASQSGLATTVKEFDSIPFVVQGENSHSLERLANSTAIRIGNCETVLSKQKLPPISNKL